MLTRDSFSSHDGQQFSTIDNDNDKSENSTCAGFYRSGWWYRKCSNADLNSIYQNSSTVGKSGIGLTWIHWKGNNYSLKRVEMKVRKPALLI